MKAKKKDLVNDNKVFLWIVILTAAILFVPLLMTNITSEWDWSLGDFVIIGVLLVGMGSLFVAIARILPKKYRLLIGIVITLLTLWIWAELAVGIFTNIGS